MQAIVVANNTNTPAHVAATLERVAERKAVLADRYKTRMCRNFEESGRCPYEMKCMFAHGEAELRTTEMNMEDGLVTEEAIKAFQRQILIKKQQIAAPALQSQQQPLVSAPQQQVAAEASPSPVKRNRTVVRQHDVYAHQPYAAQPMSYGYNYYGGGSCQCADCVAAAAYVPPAPSAEEMCQCADCVAYYKAYGYPTTSAPAVMEP